VSTLGKLSSKNVIHKATSLKVISCIKCGTKSLTCGDDPHIDNVDTDCVTYEEVSKGVNKLVPKKDRDGDKFVYVKDDANVIFDRTKISLFNVLQNHFSDRIEVSDKYVDAPRAIVDTLLVFVENGGFGDLTLDDYVELIKST